MSAGLAAPEQPTQEAEAGVLPKWVSASLRKVLRNCHEGRYDAVFHTLLSHPPRGGQSNITCSTLIEERGLKEETTKR